jgi:hypothetical protein
MEKMNLANERKNQRQQRVRLPSPVLIAMKNSKPTASRVSHRLLHFFAMAERMVNKAAASLFKMSSEDFVELRAAILPN